LVLPPSALDMNTSADVALDFTAMSTGRRCFLLVIVLIGMPWLLSTMRHPAGSAVGSAPPVAVARLPTTTQPPGRMPSAVVSPTPPGQDRPAGSFARLANSCIEPVGDTCTSVVPVPWTLDLLLKLLTSVFTGHELAGGGRDDGHPVGIHVAVDRNVEATCAIEWS